MSYALLHPTTQKWPAFGGGLDGQGSGDDVLHPYLQGLDDLSKGGVKYEIDALDHLTEFIAFAARPGCDRAVRRLFGCVRHVKVTGCVLVRAFGKMGLPRKQWRQQSPFEQSCCKHHVHWQHMGGSVYSKTAKPAQLKVKLSDFEMLDGQGGRWGRADATASMLATVFQQHNSSNNFRTFIRLMLIFVARPLAGQGLPSVSCDASGARRERLLCSSSVPTSQ